MGQAGADVFVTQRYVHPTAGAMDTAFDKVDAGDDARPRRSR
jgi:hypothetical protein